MPDHLRPLATVGGLDLLKYSGGPTPEAIMRVLPGAESHIQGLLNDDSIQHDLVIRDLAEHLRVSVGLWTQLMGVQYFL